MRTHAKLIALAALLLLAAPLTAALAAPETALRSQADATPAVTAPTAEPGAGSATGSTVTEDPANASDLAETSWILSSLGGELALRGAPASLEFGRGDVLTGSDGCNRFRTTYAQEGGALSIATPAAATLMACPEPVMAQADAFMAALEATAAFIASERNLVLLGDGDILATFVALPSGLPGTAWDVVNYNNGREAVVGLLEGTEIDAVFGEDGDLTGSAGCNQYFAGYETEGDLITIGAPGATRRFCAEPPGVMEQEAAYVAALASAATWNISGDQLQLRTAGDQLAVLMVRKEIVDLPELPPDSVTPTGRVVAAIGLNIRSGPGTNFPVVGFARYGDEGEITGRSADGRWWVTPLRGGANGWASADWVIASNADDVPVVEAPPPPPVPPTPTRRPTTVPAPSTPTRVPPPKATPLPQMSFSADRTKINAGECVTLSWSVENVQAVWVYPQGQPYRNFPRAGQGSERVCPNATTTWEMRVLQRDGNVVVRQVTINVAQQAVPPTATIPAPPADPLAGTRWQVANYNNGRGAVVGLIEGTRVNMDFGTDGQVTGNAGCNNFFAAYRAGGDAINIGTPGASRMYCGAPEGVMDQEADFLRALDSAVTFRIDGNRLELRGAGGELAVMATR